MTETLRDLLHESVADADMPDLAEVAWTDGGRVRRRRALSAVAGAAAVVLVVGGVVWAVDQRESHRAAQPVRSPSPTAPSTPAVTGTPYTGSDKADGDSIDDPARMRRLPSGSRIGLTGSGDPSSGVRDTARRRPSDPTTSTSDGDPPLPLTAKAATAVRPGRASRGQTGALRSIVGGSGLPYRRWYAGNEPSCETLGAHHTEVPW